MAYTINLSNGDVLTSLRDGTIDSTSTSLVLIGKNYAGYGEFVAENFVRILENAANSTSPVNPLVGQLWYDTINGKLNVYSASTGFKALALATSAADQPEDPTVGDQWFDTVNSQLFVWNGDQFVLIGPAFTGGTSGAVADTITDNIAVEHIIVKLVVDDAIVAIVSKDAEFTPAIAIGGFSATIKPGIQLAENIGGQVPVFDGTATNADLLDSLDSTQFLRSDEDDWTTGIIEIRNDSGLWVGADNDARLTVSADDVRLSNATASGDIRFSINSTDRLIVDGTTNTVTVDTSLTVTNNVIVDQDLTVSGTVNALEMAASADITLGAGSDIISGTGSRIQIEQASAAAPSLVFNEAGSDTGLFSPGDNIVGFTTVGVERLRIEANGTLNVSGTANYEALVTADDDVPNKKYVDDTITALLNAMYPIGAVFVGANPATIPLMPGTWVATPAGTFLQATGNGSQGAVGTTAGANTKTLSLAEMPSHNHGGGNHSHTYVGANFAGTADGANPNLGSNIGRTTDPSGAIIATQGSNASWDKRPSHRVVDMWTRTA